MAEVDCASQPASNTRRRNFLAAVKLAAARTWMRFDKSVTWLKGAAHMLAMFGRSWLRAPADPQNKPLAQWVSGFLLYGIRRRAPCQHHGSTDGR